jgi:hypothetical protein
MNRLLRFGSGLVGDCAELVFDQSIYQSNAAFVSVYVFKCVSLRDTLVFESYNSIILYAANSSVFYF